MNCCLSLLVGDDPSLFGIDKEHAARLKATPVFDVFGGDFEHAGFGPHDDQVVLGDRIP